MVQGLKFAEWLFLGVFFADDIVFMGIDGQKLQSKLQIVGDLGRKKKLEFNPGKSKVMVNWCSPSSTQDWHIKWMRVGEVDRNAVRVGECEWYKYLGV